MERYIVLNAQFLFTPGPVNVAENLRSAVIKSDICHRELEFDTLLSNIEHKILSLFQIEKRNRYRVVVITGSGTAANESMLSSVAGQGDVLILSNGEFGERLANTSKIHNAHTHVIEKPWGKGFDLSQIEAFLDAHKVSVIAMVHHETCSGMLNPLHLIGALAQKHGALFIVDGVSSVGAEPVDMEGCNIAFCSSSSSKAIGSYPGLSFVIGQTIQFEKLKHHKPKTTYLDLALFYRFLTTTGQTPNTPAIPLFFALDQALTNILSEGVVKRFDVIRQRANDLRRGMLKLNLKFLIDEKDMCSILTTVHVPWSVNVSDLRRRLRENGIIIYEGKGCFKDKVFQVGNIGEMTDLDIIFFLQNLEVALLKCQAGGNDDVDPIRKSWPTLKLLDQSEEPAIS
ncbi:pyridoxal-phosphate-dependent aminotransferase family protein [Halocynthiibacter styelae]|uniref:Alanine--glyoxylate aminotransferase family protein n=1 Tax=Halocynthiibacter styelae TaxID=2761955 RepID=A0A8J7LM61_9RHOB|nr:alanine--glyoxylate aminotransferase family protein [Paenihalocynthiibacter styelae]MBI1495459.1 alanine--glyoxylate aminotransferase family protein [Paenihalocynthiibacter styelae]